MNIYTYRIEYEKLEIGDGFVCAAVSGRRRTQWDILGLPHGDDVRAVIGRIRIRTGKLVGVTIPYPTGDRPSLIEAKKRAREILIHHFETNGKDIKKGEWDI